jgi:MFS family permease
LLIISNAVFISATLVMGFLIIAGLTQFWHILLATFILHTLNAFEMPVRQVFITEIVGRDHTINGVALNGLAMRMSSVIGAALIGAFINWIGIGLFFFLIGGLAIIALVAVLLIRIDSDGTMEATAETGQSMITDIVNGLKYVGKKKVLLGLQLIALSHNFFTGVCLFTLMPVFASVVLNIDASSLGWINTMSGLGSLVAGLTLASFSRSFKHKGWLIPIGALLEGGMWILFSMTTSYYFSVLYVTSSAIGMLTYMTAIETLLLTNSDTKMRGRVMGIRALVILPQAAWGLILGALSQVIGVPITIALAGASHCLATVAVILLVPSIVGLE